MSDTRKKAKLALPSPPDREGAIRENARQSFLRDLVMIRDLGRQEGYAHMVFAQPEVMLEDDALLTEVDRKIKELTAASLTDPAQASLMHEVAKLLPDMFAKRGLDFHDLTRIAGLSTSGRPLYVDYCHLSPEGAKVLGEVIAGIMAPKVLELARKVGSKG